MCIHISYHVDIRYRQAVNVLRRKYLNPRIFNLREKIDSHDVALVATYLMATLGTDGQMILEWDSVR